MTDLTATIAKLTPRGRNLMTMVGQQRFSYFDDGVTEGSGIWGSCLAPEMGVSARSAAGIMVGTQKLGLWGTTEDAEDGTWWYLTELGANVACALAYDATQLVNDEDKLADPKEQARVEELYDRIEESAKPVTKAVAYDTVKLARGALSRADEATYRGTDAELVAELLLAEQLIGDLRRSVELAGINRKR